MSDVAICLACTIQRAPDLTFAEEADVVEWVLNSQSIMILRGNMGLAYAFQNCSATLVAPGFVIELGNGAAPSPGGITVSFASEHSNVTVGADGKAITSVFARRAGLVTVRLLKNSPANKSLSQLLNVQKQVPNLVSAQMVLTVRYQE